MCVKKQAKGLEFLWDWKTWYQQKPSCSFIELPSYHTLLTVTLPGISARQAIVESLNVYKKEDSERFLRIKFLATRNYWQKQTYHRYTIDDYRTLLSSCIKLSIHYCHKDFFNLFQSDSGSYHLRKREFVQSRFLSVTYGKHSLRYLGPKLWNDLTSIRNLPSLKQFKSVIRNQDLTALVANASDCRGYKLCQEWLIDYRSLFLHF